MFYFTHCGTGTAIVNKAFSWVHPPMVAELRPGG